MYSFWDAWHLSPFLYSAAGAALGIIWGAMPGLSTTMGMALILQLTYRMDLLGAVAFMMGTYTGSVFGGAITAVLVNIPGTPDSVPTQLAGYPLALRGQGAQALGMAIMASFIGNWAGIFVLMALTPVALALALRFGSWEQFLLALWGILIAGSLSGEAGSPIKGWISGWLGLAVAMVGIEPILGYRRFTFGNPDLLSGIAYVPALIGLFGLAEVFRVLTQRQPTGIPREMKGSLIPPLSLLLKYWKSIVRSSMLGTIIGIIPGAGPPMASFLAYELGQRHSGEDFSKGSHHGVLCSETANNAVIGGSLLPAMTLGIPGTAAVAIFMASLSLHGVIVGPTIEMSHPGFMNFLYGTLILANFLMYALAILLIKPSIFLFSMPQGVLMPAIAAVCVVGAFTLNLSMFDVYVMFFFGLVGYIFRKYEFPLAPMVLAMLLGPMADENFRKAMTIFTSETWLDILARPVGTVLLLIVIATLVDGIRRSRQGTAGSISLAAVSGDGSSQR